VAIVVCAVAMRVAFFAALMTMADDFFRNLLGKTIVKNKIFASEFIFQSFFLNSVDVLDNSAFEMKNFGKTLMQKIRARLFAADSARAV
jgi:hypothetical protein